MESSGYLLTSPNEPEPRNVVTAPATGHAALSGGGVSSNSAVASNTTGANQEALDSSASPADVSRDAEPVGPGQESQADASGSGWQWADRAQICAYHAVHRNGRDV